MQIKVKEVDNGVVLKATGVAFHFYYCKPPNSNLSSKKSMNFSDSPQTGVTTSVVMDHKETVGRSLFDSNHNSLSHWAL